jgi:small-conductance mechanosensitive channel
VAGRAEEVTRLLRDFDALRVPGPGIAAIERRLPDLGDRVTGQLEDTTRQLGEHPPGPTLDGLTSQWHTLRAELTTYVNVLAERATVLEGALQRLAALQETWTRARTDARASRTPAQVVERIDGILSAIARTRAQLQEERAATLVLQDRVAQRVVQCDDVLARLAAARHELAARLLARDGVPLWRTDDLSGAVTGLLPRVRQGVDYDLAEIRRYASDRPGRLLGFGILLVALAVVTYSARSRAHRLAAGADTSTVSFTALEYPLAAALLLTLLAAGLSSPRSRAIQALGEMLVLVAGVRVLRRGLRPPLASALVGLGAVLMLDLSRRLVATVPLLDQQIFLLEIVVVLAALGWQLGRQHWPGASRAAPWPPAIRSAAVAALVAFTVAGTAAVAGYQRLAVFIGSGILGNAFLALTVYAALQVTRGLVAVALASPPLAGLRMVQRHRPLLERRAAGVLRWVAIGGWVIFALRHFGLWHSAVTWAEAALGAELRRGALTVSLGAVLVLVLTLAATFLLSAVVRFVLEEEIYPRRASQRALPYALSSLVHYGLVTLGFLIGLAAVGIDLTKITILAGALGVGIGFGLQGLVNNFVSGLILLYERRINLGDAVQIGDVAGQVQQLGIRACTVRTWEGAEVIVPNASLVSDKVINWTLSDHRRRIDVPIGVAYGTPPEKVADVLLGVARAHPHVVDEPGPVVLFQGFGDSALQFELRVWTGHFDRWLATRSELTAGGYAALRAAAIEIPFPQREVRLRRE